MARGKGRGGRAGRGGKGREGGAPCARTERWSNVVTDSPRFESYYKAQKVVPEEEWDAFNAALHEPLPTTFRITGCREVAPRLNQMIKDVFVPFLSGIEYEGVPLEAPKPIEWYPNGFAWSLKAPRQAIRKQEEFKKFQHFLVHEADVGNISRQEAVSMIPPLLLDVKPHHYVLDMCAAPGSKSVQLVEALNAKTASISSTEASAAEALSTLPTGILIANDSDAKRCHLLVHQSLHRVPGAGMMVTNHDATQLPGLRLPSEIKQHDNKLVADDEVKMESEAERKKYQPLLFDRILADVPCSGDGTLRKNIGIWKEFTPGNGIGLHSLQLRILLRGIALLKPGGRLVYSTCSMNPIENEAVVSAALAACPEMSLLNVSDQLPNLVRRPGMTSWSVIDNTLKDAPHPDDAEATAAHNAANSDGKRHRKVWNRTLWPNGKEAERGLERCLRIYPHLQDTGAFFVSVLVKAGGETESASESKGTVRARASSPVTEQPETKRPRQEEDTVEGEAGTAPAEPKPEVDASAETDAAKAEVDEEEVNTAALPAEIVGANFSQGPGEFKEEPFIYLSPEDEQVKLIMDFFELDPSFPAASLLVRNAQGAALRSVYFTSTLARSLLLANSYARMRLISCGVKLFTRQDSSKDGTYRCKWRVNSEGLDVLRPFMGKKRIVQANVKTLRTLMSSMTVNMTDLEEEQFKDRVGEMEPGSCVLEVEAKGEGVSFEQNLFLPFWRSKMSVNLMVEKADKSALSQRLFGEDLTPHKPAPKARDVARAAAEEASAANSGAETPVTTEGEAEVDAEAKSDEPQAVATKSEEKVEETPASASAA